MSERFGECKRCKGSGIIRDLITLQDKEACIVCDGTGCDGSAEAYENRSVESRAKELERHWMGEDRHEIRKY